MEHGATGLLAEPGDPQGLPLAVCWLLEHPEEAAAIGRRGRECVRSFFAPEVMCASLDACYRDLLGLPTAWSAPTVPPSHRRTTPADSVRAYTA